MRKSDFKKYIALLNWTFSGINLKVQSTNILAKKNHLWGGGG